MKSLNYSLVLLLLASLYLSNCSKDEETTVWLIPESDVFDGGPGKDGIPSIDDPKFTLVGEVEFLEDDDLVVIVKVNEAVKIYPHPILDWHEIVNDEIGDRALAITYCPLTGTAIGWDRELDNGVTTFGVSGLLYNTNLIPYDRASDSNWSQMQLRSVNGQRAGERIETYPVAETSWATAKALYPDADVLNTDTGFSRDYQRYPYGDYRTNDNLLLFPVDNEDDRLDAKDRGLGILINDESKFYPLSFFETTGAILDEFQGTEIVVIGSQANNFLRAFENQLADGTMVTPVAPSPIGNDGVFTDLEGNEWNLFGETISGPRIGQQLTPVESFMSFWFAWATFYPDVELAQ